MSQANDHGAPPVQPLDPLALQLAGTQVIEASAGTGKTWTLAALYLRLVLGHGREGAGLLPPQILVMTFTEAATAELRGRIRARLAEAARHFRDPDLHPGDAFLTGLRQAYPPAQQAACAHRLDLAAQWMDDAAIYTIHGWSSRMLRQHAFDSASLFEQSKVEDGEGLKLAAVRDYWRQWFYPLPEPALQALDAVARTPDDLLARLKPLWQAAERQPGGGPEAADDPVALLRGWSEWQREVQALETQARALWATHREALHAQLTAAMARDLSGTVYRKDKHGDYLAQLDAWSQGAARDAANLRRFALASLLRNTKKSGTPPADPHGVFEALGQLVEGLAGEPPIAEALLAHAAQAVGRAYENAKQQLAQFDFSDLLQRLHQALQAEDGRLAQAIRAQYPVALVDEFQDTDPWQWGALARIYPPSDAQDAEGAAPALVLIGDPKQAIYSFRGADLATYLAARQQAQAIHTLSGNFRSTGPLVNAVNHVFAQADQPFGAIAFEPVEARNPEVQPLRLPGQDGGACQPAMTLWHLASATPLTAKAYQQAMAELFASQMVALLNGRVASPGQMAVLVRNGHEARAMREALARRGVRSVYLSDRDSVYATREAADLWHVLRAVAQPRSVAYLRAALSTRSFCRRLDELDHMIRDEAAWDAQVENFGRWHQTWQRQGFLAMLYQLLHEQEIPRRLRASAPDPERRLTNLLHLGDLLQKASLELQGEGALVRYLADQLHDPAVSGEAAQMRLETDANLVQVVTMHKSKGLQYPLVFLPFVANFQAEKAASGRDDAERLAEDIRLLYVALTRAEQALWLGVAARKDDFASGQTQPRSALSRLLGRASADDLAARLQHWAACPDIVVAPAPEATAQAHLTDQAPAAAQPARRASRDLASHWWQASFSALTRDLAHGAPAGLSEAPSEDEERFLDALTDSLERVPPEADAADAAPAATPAYNAFPAGSSYGTLLHDLLEWQLREGWPLLQDPAAGDAQRRWQRLLASQAESLQLEPAACALLERWIAQIAATALPLAGADPARPGLRLGALDLSQAWPEMGFTLMAHGLGAQAIDQLIQQHVLPGAPREPLRPRALQGLLTGFMDLVFEHAGRYYVLDYKSNRLPAYTAEALRQAILAHRYDVQATLYLLALHRLLKARLPGYDYERHVGGAVYLFARGIDQQGAGVHLERPPRALLEALDQAFATPSPHPKEPA